MKLKNRTVMMMYLLCAAMILIYWAMKFFGVEGDQLEIADIVLAVILFWLPLVLILRESSVGHKGEKKGNDKKKQDNGSKQKDKREDD